MNTGEIMMNAVAKTKARIEAGERLIRVYVDGKTTEEWRKPEDACIVAEMQRQQVLKQRDGFTPFDSLRHGCSKRGVFVAARYNNNKKVLVVSDITPKCEV